jgi:GTP-binding protein
MADQTLTAIDDADVLLFILDGREGLTEADKAIARTLRKSGKTVILAANKCEGRTDLAEMHGLGFGELLELSAEHALGFADLAEVLAPLAPRAAVPNDEEDEAADEIGEEQEEQDEDYTSRPLRLALVGRPNVGKSSLFNRLLGDERSIVGPEAGLTRDAIVAPWKAGERDILLHDTAGLRKKARVAGEVLEGMSVSSTVEAIRFADCVIVMIDANQPFEKQDLAIADLIAREGRAIVFAVNKWDLKEEKNGAISELREKLDRLLPQVAGAALVAVSAKTGQGLDRLVPAVIAADKAWNSRAPTAALNRFLESALLRHATPAVSGRRVKIRYMTQIKSRPPTFTLFGNQLDALPESYARYLTNGLREAFDLKGTPLRLLTRNTKNPYDTKK